ncbi:Pex12 amino terminal region-domain-containing protein [Vararia minispora EC-137]|uniref:Pex12 amino terminal region-domain-containing protein n=1 Tax=Vararia minispora EC-137 TaxID=1314806 RepID=A0ACB8QQ81_9AGAM|nr:Pex12 amino terminal region-domain-containing protein [Vararia minispora EC-137]
MQPRIPTFPPAQQAQIIRAHQRDVIHVVSLREQAENILRVWLAGSRRLARYDKEIEFVVKLVYFGLTTGRAIQTLGEEYTGIWTHPGWMQSRALLAALVLVPTVPPYLLARFGSALIARSHALKAGLQTAVSSLEVLSELNLAIFYFRGTYYDIVRRLLGASHVSSIPENPHSRPPSYSLLGVLILIRLLHRLLTFLRSLRSSSSIQDGKRRLANSPAYEPRIDGKAVIDLLNAPNSDSALAASREDNQLTMLDLSTLPPMVRAGRKCPLCLEEREGTCATECGHLFDWDCIYSWGREKSECPLCRQALDLTKLLPIYNL